MLKDMTVKARMRLNSGVAVLLAAIIGVIGFAGMVRLSDTIDSMEVGGVLATRYLAKAQDAMWQLRYGISQYLAVPDPESRRKIITESPKWFDIIENNIKLFSSGNLSSDARTALQEFNDVYRQYKESRPQWFELMEAGKIQEAAEFRAKTIFISGAGSVKALSKLIEVQTKRSDDISKESDVAAGKAKRQVIVIAVILVVASMLIAAWITRGLQEQLGGEPHYAADIARKVAEGDLTMSITTKENDTSSLVCAMKNMVDDLRLTIADVRRTADSVGDKALNMRDVSTRVADGGRRQMGAVEEAASSANEMHQSLKQIAGNVEDLNQSAEKTSSAVTETAASIEEVSRTMNDLASAVEETTTAITQMSAAIQQIAESVESLSSGAEETASAANEISSSVKFVEENAQRSASLAEAVSSDAQKLGIRSIEKTIEGMQRIEEATRQTAEVINRLGSRTENIGNILTVIEGITDQTSLLALNAAILAAQAGEHGKGFAVVAGDIRSLADRTAASTKEIGSLILSVQGESREAVEVMQTGVKFVEEGARLANEAGAALKAIVERADESRDMSKGISKAAQEQAMSIKQLSSSVDRINGMAHQIARSTNEQRSGSQQIKRAAERMREISLFVKGATTEQAKSGKEITESVETIRVKIGLVHRGADEVKTGSDLIVKATERIREIAKENVARAAQLDEAVDGMTEQAAALKKGMEGFTT